MVVSREQHSCQCVSLTKIVEVIQVYFSNVSPFEETDEQYYGLARAMVLKGVKASTWEVEFLGSMTFAMASGRELSMKQKAVMLRMAARYLMGMDEERARELARVDEEGYRAMVLE